jgi:hypothetical protein
MKMISNTSMTSTIGVTLISELIFLPSFLLLIPMPRSANRALSGPGLHLRSPGFATGWTALYNRPAMAQDSR